MFEVFVDNQTCFFLANMYLPYDMRSAESQVLYKQVLGEFQCVINDLNSNKLLALVDNNADPTRTRILNHFAAENNLSIDSPAHNTTS